MNKQIVREPVCIKAFFYFSFLHVFFNMRYTTILSFVVLAFFDALYGGVEVTAYHYQT
jgi:hypothetical protein